MENFINLQELKYCTKCNENLPLLCFSFRKDTGKYRNYCNRCYKGYSTSRNLKSFKYKQLIQEGLVTCARCKKIMTVDKFNIDINTAHGYTSRCKQCLKELREENIEKVTKNSKTRRYSLTEKDWVLFENTTKCKICGKVFETNIVSSFRKEKIDKQIDHNHTTKEFRGILCANCNTGLGAFKDNIQNLKAAIYYLQIEIDKNDNEKYNNIPLIETLKD